MNPKTALMLSSAIALVSIAGQAWAADEALATRRSEETTVLNELIVTAQRREESLQDVPVAVTAFTAERRDLIGINSLQDFAKFTPGMSANSANNGIVMRGVGRVTLALGTDQGVATYYDGVYESQVAFVTLPPIFAERTEVLRGPQGTLYGRNSIGGAINIISKRPGKSFDAEVRQELGNYERSYTAARVSGPLTDQLGILLGATFDFQGKGYIHNIAGNDVGVKSDGSIEAQLQYEPSERLRIWLKYNVSWLNSRFDLGNSRAPYNTTNPMINGLVPNPLFGYTTPNPGVANIRRNNIDFRGSTTSDIPTQVGVAQVDWDLGPAALKYTFGYTRFKATVEQDIDYISRGDFLRNGTTVSGGNIYHAGLSGESYSNELNLSSKEDGRLRWLVGLFQFKDDQSGPFNLRSPGQPQLERTTSFASFFSGGNVIGAPNPNREYLTTEARSHATSYAIYGQADYKLTDAVTLTGGLRYTWDRKSGYELLRLVLFDPVNLPPVAFDLLADPVTGVPGPNYRNIKGSWEGYTGRLSLAWEPSDDVTVYGSASRGYKSGGFALINFDAQPLVAPEYLNAYEAGMKATVRKQLTLNTAIFYYDYKNLQIQKTYDTGVEAGGAPTGLFLSRLINVPKSRSYGFEAEAVYQPTPDLQLLVSYGYLNAKYKELDNVVDTTLAVPVARDLAGENMQLSPRHKIALNGVYTFRFDPGSLALSATYAWTDRQHVGVFDTPLSNIPAHDSVDLRATWTDARQRFKLVGYVANATNALSQSAVSGSAAFQSLPGFNVGRLETLDPPRTYGVQLRVFF